MFLFFSCSIHSSGDLGLKNGALPGCPQVGSQACQYRETKGIEVCVQSRKRGSKMLAGAWLKQQLE